MVQQGEQAKQLAGVAAYGSVAAAWLGAPDLGARHPFGVLVPVDWRRFQVYWTRSTLPPWPQHASYGFNAYVNAYLR
jgi:hypothetical protein